MPKSEMIKRLNQDAQQLRAYLQQPRGGTEYLEFAPGEDEYYYDLPVKDDSAYKYLNLGGVNHFGKHREPRAGGTLIAPRVLVGLNQSNGGRQINDQGRLYDEHGNGDDFNVEARYDIPGTELQIVKLDKDFGDWSQVYPVLVADPHERGFNNKFGTFQVNGYKQCIYNYGFLHPDGEDEHHYPNNQPIKHRGTQGWPTFSVLQQTPDHGDRRVGLNDYGPGEFDATFLPILVSLHTPRQGTIGQAFSGYVAIAIDGQCDAWGVERPTWVNDLQEDLSYTEPGEDPPGPIPPPVFPQPGLPIWARLYDSPPSIDTLDSSGKVLFINKPLARRTESVAAVRRLNRHEDFPSGTVMIPGQTWAGIKDSVLMISGLDAQNQHGANLGTSIVVRWPSFPSVVSL